MRGKKVKQLRKYIIENIDEVLLMIRSEVGDKTQDMDPRRIYQYVKRMYKQGRLSL